MVNTGAKLIKHDKSTQIRHIITDYNIVSPQQTKNIKKIQIITSNTKIKQKIHNVPSTHRHN